MILWACILARIVSNPISNVFQKILTRRGAAPLFIIVATFGILALACASFVPFLNTPAASQFWIDITLCAILAIAGNVTLVAALKRSDLSILGPINAYKSIVSLVPAIVLLHEFPTFWQLAGILLIVAGSFVVVGRGEGNRTIGFLILVNDRGVQLRFAALIFSAAEAVFIKRALIVSSPSVTFILWAVLGFFWGGVTILFSNQSGLLRANVASISQNKSSFLLLALTTGIMQFSTLVTLRDFGVGPALALFQTSTILTVILGRTIFTEGQFVRRMLGSLVMVGGAIMIIVFR